MSETLHRTIRGEPYTFVFNRDGWGVCPACNPIERMHRSYQVYCLLNGEPTRCTCPAYQHFKHCKHKAEAWNIYFEQHPEALEALQEEAHHCGLEV